MGDDDEAVLQEWYAASEELAALHDRVRELHDEVQERRLGPYGPDAQEDRFDLADEGNDPGAGEPDTSGAPVVATPGG